MEPAMEPGAGAGAGAGTGALHVVNPLFLAEHGGPRATRGWRRTTLRRTLHPAQAPQQALEPGRAGAPQAVPLTLGPATMVPLEEDEEEEEEEEEEEDAALPALPPSPHRASWIEGPEDAATLLPAPCPEQAARPQGQAGAQEGPPWREALPGRVLNRLSAVGGALGGLLFPERRLARRVLELLREPGSYVGGLARNFMGRLQAGGPPPPSSTALLHGVRQELAGLRDYLCASSELLDPAEGDPPDLDVGAVVESALHKYLLKPVCSALYARLEELHEQDGSLARLRRNQERLRGLGPGELGASTPVPSSAALGRIRARLARMHRAYSPRAKAALLLEACRLIYAAMEQGASAAEPHGADDFLPVLTYVLLRCDIIAVQLDVEYMMELLDPSLLQGEDGYYLTTWFGALYHVAHTPPAGTARQLSAEAQCSIQQWQRRRTIHPGQRRAQSPLFGALEELPAEQHEPPGLAPPAREGGSDWG
ncbi:ras and Rab interactor-like protein isoform X2 [Alligator mississippiensis]|uniref:ras and Rab interactor-like protein isoform X2 n=1 Tax=Alligator mississippiensis TaxID=8496 RepID=UPI002877B666|nr:ras and Rab interactor-like protein isoform X2 [Alligator mississippiensis]